MGTAASTAYNWSLRRVKHIYYAYNGQNRAVNYIGKEKPFVAPRHKSVERTIEDETFEKIQLDHLYEKNKQLDDHLKKVYVTSSPPVKNEVITTRPLPIRKDIEESIAFYEPPIVKSNTIHLSSVVKLLYEYHGKANMKVADVALNHNLQRDSVINLFTYYSLFQNEDCSFMNEKEVQEKQDDKPKKVTFEVYEKKGTLIKLIEGKK